MSIRMTVRSLAICGLASLMDTIVLPDAGPEMTLKFGSFWN